MAMAKAKAIANVLVKTLGHTKPSIAIPFYQPLTEKLGWSVLAKKQAHCGVLSPPGEGCPQGGVGSPMLCGTNFSWRTEPMKFLWKLLITRIFPD
jgi:hypothetical protein